MVSIVPVVVVDVSVHCEDAVKVGLPAASRWPANPPQRPQSSLGHDGTMQKPHRVPEVHSWSHWSLHSPSSMCLQDIHHSAGVGGQSLAANRMGVESGG